MADTPSTLALSKKETARRVIKNFNTVVTVLLMFGVGFLPPFSTLTPVGMRLLGIFLGVVYGFCTCGIIWPALLAIVAYGTSGYVPMATAISSMLGNNSAFTSLAILITGGAMSYYGFGKWFVRWSLSTRLFKGKPMLYVWSFFVVFGLVSLVISQVALGLILFTIWEDIADTCEYPENSSFRYVGLVGVMLAVTLGGAMVPYDGWCLSVATSWAEVTGERLNLGLMALMNIPITILILTVYVFVSKWVFKVDYSIMKAFDVEKLGEDSKFLRPRTKRIAIMYVSTVAVCIFSNTFPKLAWCAFINDRISTAGMYALCAAILMIMPSGEKDGRSVIEFDVIKNDAMSWNVFFMCAVATPLATALSNKATGVMPWITGVFEPIFEGRGTGFILTFTVIVALILTNVGSNLAFGLALIPVIAPFVLQSGMNPQFAGAALVYVVNIGILLPSASVPAAVFHAQPGVSNTAMRFKVCLLALACAMTVCIIMYNLYSVVIG